MSLGSRLKSLEGRLKPPPPPEDQAFEYIVTAAEFTRICHNLRAIFGPPPDTESMLKQFTPEQVRHVWLNHYAYYVNGKLTDPPADWIEDLDRLGARTLQEWYEATLMEILRFPHRISFDLSEFGLDDWIPKVLACPDIDYAPPKRP